MIKPLFFFFFFVAYNRIHKTSLQVKRKYLDSEKKNFSQSSEGIIKRQSTITCQSYDGRSKTLGNILIISGLDFDC
jgi:hypothetical protein